jgi:5-methylthioadenosine/S-adenosylhomocysteine deaminase
LGVGIHIHVSETQKQVDLSLEEYGKTPVELLAESGVLDVPTILGYCSFPTDDDIKILSQVDTGVAHAPKTHMKLGGSIINLYRFRNAGIPVALATDSAVSSNSLDILEQMRLMALTQKMTRHDASTMPVSDVLRIAFQGGADVMHMPDDIGALAPGKLADLVLLKQTGLSNFPRFNQLSNLIYSLRTADVQTVICDGNILLRDGKLLTIDKAQVMREITPRLNRLSKRVPGNRVATYPT